MNPELSDAMIDAQLLSYLQDRAEDAAAHARTPEQVLAEMSVATRPRFWTDRLAQRPAHLAWLVALALLVLALLAALAVGGWLRSPIAIRIAIELPFGRADSAASSIAHGVELAVNDMNGRTGRFRIEIPRSVVLSDTVDGEPDDPLGATNMASIAADPDVVAVIGPFNSSVAQAQLPISRAAGLLQCSPANTDPQLTRPSAESDPGRANYIRVVTTDDVAAAAAARFVLERLGKTSVAVLDDNQGAGTAMADWFAAEFTRLGGNVVWRAGLSNTTAGISTMLASARATNPQAIYFGGSGDAAATLVKSAADAGLGGSRSSGPMRSTTGAPPRRARSSILPARAAGRPTASFRGRPTAPEPRRSSQDIERSTVPTRRRLPPSGTRAPRSSSRRSSRSILTRWPVRQASGMWCGPRASTPIRRLTRSSARSVSTHAAMSPRSGSRSTPSTLSPPHGQPPTRSTLPPRPGGDEAGLVITSNAR